MNTIKNELIANRQGVWEAISNFYLDTELTPSDYEYLATMFIKSKYNIDELKDIDLYEVFPTLYLNLLSVAGVWDGFDKTWLNEKCYENYIKRDSFAFRVKLKIIHKLFKWIRKGNWEEIEKRIRAMDQK